MKVSFQCAQEHFPDIAQAASSGEEVEIALPGQTALFLASRRAQPSGTPTSRPPRRGLLGAWEGKVKVPTDAEWKAMKRELEDQMLDMSKFMDEPV